MSLLRDNLVEIIDNLSNTGIINSSLITEDGIVVASNNTFNQESKDLNKNIGAISASIISIAEKGLEILSESVLLEQIKIDVGIDENIEHDFTILIERVCSNLLLQILFPKRLNIGVIHYETKKSISLIKKIINDKNIKELFTNIDNLS